jgi:hypothetical protein
VLCSPKLPFRNFALNWWKKVAVTAFLYLLKMLRLHELVVPTAWNSAECNVPN